MRAMLVRALHVLVTACLAAGFLRGVCRRETGTSRPCRELLALSAPWPLKIDLPDTF